MSQPPAAPGRVTEQLTSPFDARLIQADEIWPERFLQEKLSYDDNSALHEHITLSYLLGVRSVRRMRLHMVSKYTRGSLGISPQMM